MARLFNDINRRIGDYLAVKTLVNIILGAVSYVIMLVMALDFALFWAVLIALFNYIPFIGTFAIIFPIFLSLAQFGSLTTTLILAALLLMAQLISDNVLEPKLFSRQLNLSPFVIIVALSFWTALWGLAGSDPRHPDHLDGRDHLRGLSGDAVHRAAPCRAGRRIRNGWRAGQGRLRAGEAHGSGHAFC